MTAARQLIPLDRIVDMLASRIGELAPKLLPGGIRDGREFRVGSLDGEPGRSMAVRLEGDRQGVWCDFSTGETGDAFDLVAQVLYRGDKKQALPWARAWLGLDGTNPDALRTTRRAVEIRDKQIENAGDVDETEQKRRNKAFRIWLGGQEQLAGTPAERYLLGRAIDLRRLGRQPRALRFVAAHDYWVQLPPATPESKPIWRSLGQWPCLVASIVDAAGKTIAVHQTYLQVHGDGRVTKAVLPLAGDGKPYPAKKIFPRFRGGTIRLWRGVDQDGKQGKPLNEAPEGSSVILTEGIENGLSVALADPAQRILAACSIANMGAIELPPQIRAVTIFADNDEEKQARQGLAKAVDHFLAQGREVYVARAPAGVKDANDLLQLPPDGGEAA